MRNDPIKYKEIINKPTNNLYHSAFVLVEQKYLNPFRIPKRKDNLEGWF